jgi:hypothetical protein
MLPRFAERVSMITSPGPAPRSESTRLSLSRLTASTRRPRSPNMPREMGRFWSSGRRVEVEPIGRSAMGWIALCLLGSCVLPEASVDETSDGGGFGGGVSCSAPGVACAVTSQCCQAGDGIGVEGAVCGSDGTCHAGCTSSFQCKSNCCTTLPGQSSNVCAQASYCGGGAPMGSVCSDHAQCLSGFCAIGGSGTGWCSSTCTLQSECPDEPLMVCEPNSSGTEICWVSCSFSSDCAKYGAQYSCLPNGVFTVCATSGT